jgi:glycosyltransferase involved in cell wall biosynthesis
MKVLYLVDSPAPYGANVALINLLDGLITEGVEPYVTYAHRGPFVEWLEARGIECFEIPYHLSIYSKSIPRMIKKLMANHRAKKELTKLVQRIKPNIIHTNIGPLRIGYDVAKDLNIKHIWHVREYQRLDFGIYFFPSFSVYKKLIRNSHTICITQGIYDYFKLGTKSRVIYDGVMDECDSASPVQKEKHFLFVGRLEEAKGIIPLIETFYEFSKVNAEYKLKVAGGGREDYLNQINDLIRRYHLEDRIELLGFRSDCYELMQAATALIVPSLNEGFGFITAEAMFNNCLVVGHNTSGTKEIIDNSKGNAFPYSSSKELYDILVNISTNGAAYYLDMVSVAKDIALQKYTKKQHTQSVFQFYKDILNK